MLLDRNSVELIVVRTTSDLDIAILQRDRSIDDVDLLLGPQQVVRGELLGLSASIVMYLGSIVCSFDGRMIPFAILRSQMQLLRANAAILQ